MIVRGRLAEAGRVDPHVGQRFDIRGRKRVLRESVSLPQERQVGVGVVHRQEERLCRLVEELGGVGRVAIEILPLEVRLGDCGKVERKRIFGIDVELADDPSPVAGLFQTADDIGRIPAKQAEALGGEANLSVLVGLETGTLRGIGRSGEGARCISDAVTSSRLCEPSLRPFRGRGSRLLGPG